MMLLFRQLFFIAGIVLLYACSYPSPAPLAQAEPTNLLPMYGHPAVEKTARQRRVDEEFIATVTAHKSRPDAAEYFAGQAWFYLQRGELDMAMRRFNQSWLLTPDYFMPHWGFGVIVKQRGKARASIQHFEQALSLIDVETEKPRLLADTALAYVAVANALKSMDPGRSDDALAKASAAIGQALTLDSEFGQAYVVAALIFYDQGKLEQAWQMVQQAEAVGDVEFPSGFIEKLKRQRSGLDN